MNNDDTTNAKDDQLVVKSDDLLEELNLDSTAENKTVMAALIQSAQELIIDAVNSNLIASALASNQIYIRAVKALATTLYFDRTLSQGYPLGVQMMITHLKGRYAKWQ